MKKIIPTFILLMLILISCSEEELCPKQPLEKGTVTNQDEYTIIETVINAQFQNAGFMHISQGPLRNAKSENLLNHLSNSMIKFDSSDVEQYLSINNSAFIWDDQISGSFELINKDEMSCHFEPGNGGWTSYFAKYKNSEGVLSFARPYINEDGEAFLEFEMTCGWECGYGFIAILEKVGQFWVLKETINTWIS